MRRPYLATGPGSEALPRLDFISAASLHPAHYAGSWRSCGSLGEQCIVAGPVRKLGVGVVK